MWLTFWPDVLVAVIGAALTVGIAFVTYIVNLRRNELRALRSLIYEVHQRRAFSGNAVKVLGARELADYRYANASILSVRDEVRHTRDVLRDIPGLQRPLAQMTRACNRYLELSEQDPDSYAIALALLRDDLMEQIEKLAAQRRGVHVLKPGAGTFDD